MDRFRVLTIQLACMALVTAGCAQVQSMGDPLVKILTSQMDVTANQAKGGVGSTLSLAKEKLSGADFDSFTKYIPGKESYMKSAQDLGAVTGQINDQAGLQQAFSKLGMGSDKVGKFSKVLTDFVGKSGGEAAQNFLTSLMK